MNHHRAGVRSPRRIGLRVVTIISGCLALAAAMPATAAEEDPRLESTVQRLSYAVGLQIGQSLRRQGLDEIDAAALAAALEDVYAGRPPRLTIEQMQAAQAAYQAESAARQGRQAESNLAAGRAFLASNAKSEGVMENAERAPVPHPARGRGSDSHRRGPGRGPLPGPAAGRHRVRQLPRARRAHRVHARRRDPGMAGRAAAHAGGGRTGRCGSRPSLPTASGAPEAPSAPTRRCTSRSSCWRSSREPEPDDSELCG